MGTANGVLPWSTHGAGINSFCMKLLCDKMAFSMPELTCSCGRVDTATGYSDAVDYYLLALLHPVHDAERRGVSLGR